MVLSYKTYTIEVVNEPDYSFGSADSPYAYDKEYFDDKGYHPSIHGIKTIADNAIITSAVVAETGGSTTIHERSVIIKKDRIFVCCGDSVFSLNLPDLTLAWKTQLDMATCFSLYDFKEDIIVHGEVQISRVSVSGDLKWEFSARDIFVTEDGSNSIEVNNNYIWLKDWLNYEYKLDENGHEIK